MLKRLARIMIAVSSELAFCFLIKTRTESGTEGFSPVEQMFSLPSRLPLAGVLTL